MRFLMVGADRRQRCLAQFLQKAHTVSFFDDKNSMQPDCIVLPCPSFDGKGQLRADCSLEALLPQLRQAKYVFTCGAAKPLMAENIGYLDLLTDETAVHQNARLTAEAALLAAMEAAEDSLQKKCCLIIGYGRIGSYLTRLLTEVGAVCTVFARRQSSRALAEGFGYGTAAPGKAALERFDFVFNTVPAQALSRTELSMLPETCLWVELASNPGGLPQGGLPFACSVLQAGGLPGKYLPCAAARVLYEAILRQLPAESQ